MFAIMCSSPYSSPLERARSATWGHSSGSWQGSSWQDVGVGLRGSSKGIHERGTHSFEAAFSGSDLFFRKEGGGVGQETCHVYVWSKEQLESLPLAGKLLDMALPVGVTSPRLQPPLPPCAAPPAQGALMVWNTPFQKLGWCRD